MGCGMLNAGGGGAPNAGHDEFSPEWRTLLFDVFDRVTEQRGDRIACLEPATTKPRNSRSCRHSGATVLTSSPQRSSSAIWVSTALVN